MAEENAGTSTTTETPAGSEANTGVPNTAAPAGTETPAQNTPNTPAPTWPENWRQNLAGNDTKVLERLGRFNSVSDVWKSYTELETKLSSGKFRPEAPTEKSTPEEVAAYRKAAGIPEKAEEYSKALNPELVIGEEEKEAVELLYNRMHALNAPPSVVKAAVETYYDIIQHQSEQAVEAQKEIKKNAEDMLRREWGAEYRSNINAINNLIQGAPKELQDLMSSMVLADGSLAYNNPQFLGWLGRLSREINPASTVVPAGHGDPMTSVNSELAALKAQMNKDINTWQAPANAPARARYLELLKAQERLTARR